MTNINFYDLSLYGFYFLWLIALSLVLIKKNNKVFYILAFIMLVFSVFRYGSGTDYLAYKSIYNFTFGQTYQFLSLNSTYETLYFNLMVFSHSLGFNFYQFVALHSILLMVILVLWIRMSSNHPVYSLFVYLSFFFIVWNLSAFRQVIPLIVGSFLFYNQKIHISWPLKLFISILLVYFHYTALFYVVLLITELIPWNKKGLIIFFTSSLAFSFIPIREFLLSLNLFPLISNTSLYQKFYYYLSGMPASLGFFDIGSLMRVFFIVLILLHFEDLVSLSIFMKKIVHVTIVGLSFFFILKFNLLTAQRLTIYALVLLVLTLPEIVHAYQFKKKWISHLVVASFIALNGFMYFKDLYAMKAQIELNENRTDDKWYVEYHHIFEPELSDQYK